MAAADEAATAGGAGRAAGGGVGRAAGGGVGRAAGAGVGRDGAGTETSLAGRLVTSRWRSGVETTGDGALGAGSGEAVPEDVEGLVGDSVEDGPAGSDPVDAAATLSSGTRPGRVEAARAGFCSTGSSGDTARRSPSLSAFRRTRSAWASSIEDEWLFTPMPNAKQRSRASLFVRPSSRASS